MFIYCNAFDWVFLFRFSFWFTDRLLFDFDYKTSYIIVYFLLLQLVPLANTWMDLVDSFQLQIFQVTSLSTADVPGISQFPAGTSLNLLSCTFGWSHTKTFPAILLVFQGHVLRSQTLLQIIIIIIHSCFAVSLFLIQCIRWGIPFKSYSRL